MDTKIQYHQIIPSLCEDKTYEHVNITVVCYTIMRFLLHQGSLDEEYKDG